MSKKKFIAREGLIFLLYLLFLAIAVIGDVRLELYIPIFSIVVNVSYVIYWIIRFILWAMKTLKQED